MGGFSCLQQRLSAAKFSDIRISVHFFFLIRRSIVWRWGMLCDYPLEC